MLRTFVDDISQTQVGKVPSQVLILIKRGACLLAEGLMGSGCKISKKSVVLGNDADIKKKLIAYLKNYGIHLTPVSVAKDLGVGITAGVIRTQGVLKSRILTIKGRVLRIKRLRKVNHAAGKLFNSGAMPQGSYGKEGMGIAPSTLTQN